MPPTADFVRFDQLDDERRDALTDWLADCDLDWRPGRGAEVLQSLPEELHSVRTLAIVEWAKIDLERHWRQQVQISVESYLQRFPELASDEAALSELLLIEWECRQRSGEAPRFGDFARRFPQQAGLLRQLIHSANAGKATTDVASEEPVASDLPPVPIAPNTSDTNTGTEAATAATNPHLDTSHVSSGLTDSTPQAAGDMPSTVIFSPEVEWRGSADFDELPPFAASAAKSLGVPEMLGRYRVLRELGRGAMGTVYLARDTQLHRDVALKVPTLVPQTRRDVLQRFYREAKAAACLDHPHICKVYDTGEAEGFHFMVMEFIAGQSLSEFISSRHATRNAAASSKPVEAESAEATAIRLVQKVARAVGVAHERKIIHRDLKPSNIMVTSDGEPKVTDFGLARLTGIEDFRLTQSGMMLGTPAYMPPEQLTGELKQVGPHSDVYSLGVILFELLTGRLPHEIDRDTPLAVMCSRLLNEAPFSLRKFRPDLDPRLEKIIDRAMAKAPVDRFPTMSEFADALEVALDWRGQRGSNRGRIFTSLFFAAVLLLGVTLWFVQGDAVVKVEVLADDVEVSFVNAALKIVDGKKEYRVKPGEHRLHVKSGDIEFDTDNFTLKRGGNPIVTIEQTDKRILARLGEQPVGQRDLPVIQPAFVKQTPSVKEQIDATAMANTREPSKQTDLSPSSTSRKPVPAREPSQGEELEPNNWYDLLATVSIPDHVVYGGWKKTSSGVVKSDGGQAATLMIPVTIDGSFELDLEFARMGGTESVNVTFPIGTGRTSVIAGGWAGKFHGLAEVAGVGLPDLKSDTGAVTSPGKLENQQRNRLHIEVDVKHTDGHIVAVLNGQRIVDWTGDIQELAPRTDAATPLPQALCLDSWLSPTDFHALKLRVKPGSRAVCLNEDWSNSLFPVRASPPAEIADKCVKWNGRSYYFSEIPLPLTQAQLMATRLQGRLLTISSQVEEDFLAANDGGRTLWTSGWRHSETKEWRDDRNRPLRFIGRWSKSKPNNHPMCTHQILWPCGLGWSNQERQHLAFACIEWGEEYEPGSSTEVVIAPPKVAEDKRLRPKDEQWVNPKISRKPLRLEGKWWFEGDELVTESVAPSNFMSFGDESWTDFDLKVEACCNKVGPSYNLVLRWFEKDFYWLLQIGNYGAKNFDLVAHARGEDGWRAPSRRYLPNSLHGQAKVWHNVEVKTRGIHIIVIVDGQVMATSSHPKLNHGAIGFHTFSEGSARWRNLEVRTPDGRLLWKGFPTLPLEKLSETAQTFNAASDAAGDFLLAEFNKTIERLRLENNADKDAVRQRLTALEEEQALFQSQGRIPFSPVMRAASIAYLDRLAKARKEFEVEIERRLANAKNSPSPSLEELNTLKAERTRYLNPRVVGVWELYTPNGVFHDVVLYSDGTLARSIGHLPGTWSLDEQHLLFASPRPGDAGGYYVDTNIISDDGRSYSGGNQLGFKFIGKRKPVPAP